MSTAVLSAYSKAWPNITNRIRASIFLESDPLAPVASIIDTTVGHPQRIYHFAGIPRGNYGFSLDEIDSNGDVVSNLALFDVVPSEIEGYLTRNDEQIQFGTTPITMAAENKLVFDGSGGGPDYRGWEIVPSELTGRGILVRGVDYSWDSDTGEFELLLDGDIFEPGQWYNIHFNPRTDSQGGSEPTIIDFSARVVTSSENIEVSDFGNSVIVDLSGVYAELTLPIITTVPIGRPLSIEMVEGAGNSISCAKINTNGADSADIKFVAGSLYIINNERIEIYRFRKEDNTNEWRVKSFYGNFFNVGQSVSEDLVQGTVYCKQLLDGSVKDIFQFARIYNEFVLRLPANQVCNFDEWSTGNNKYLYSLANSSDPSNSNKFHFPDRRGIFERNNKDGKAGDYKDDQVKISNLSITVNQGNSYTGNGGAGVVGRGSNSPNTFTLQVQGAVGTGDETNPKQYLVNKFVIL